MRWIYLSTHLDDAVLSAGGLIYEQTKAGDPVEIWTFMAGAPSDTEYSPFAQLLHQQWGFSSAEETVRSRREEDKTAASLVGATTVHFDFLDCRGMQFETDVDGAFVSRLNISSDDLERQSVLVNKYVDYLAPDLDKTRLMSIYESL